MAGGNFVYSFLKIVGLAFAAASDRGGWSNRPAQRPVDSLTMTLGHLHHWCYRVSTF